MKPLATHKFEIAIGHLLRVGVSLSAGLVILGAAMYFQTNALAHPQYHIFRSEPSSLKSLRLVGEEAASHSNPLAVMQLGLLILIATPIARVFFSVFVFLKQKDWTYTGFTLLVLAILAYSLLGR